MTIILNVAASAPLLTGSANAYTLVSGAAATAGFISPNFFSLGTITGNSTTDSAHALNWWVTNFEVYFTSTARASTNYCQSFTGATSNDFTLAGNSQRRAIGGQRYRACPQLALNSTSG